MEVTHIEHQNTHAVIGGHAPQAYGVNANAEFYEMMSSTIYSNQKLAVAREVLCNSWDAHLMVGKANVPVEVTITDSEMSFKDFGPGISHQDIIPIYCTYGGTTKKHDGIATGGFGLGSKAPYAYTKHFTVVSCHNGKRTIYAASRGSAETQGVPDFRAMVSDIPTTDQGVTVTIPITNKEDAIAFKELVEQLVFLGGINCKLNGQLLNRLDYSRVSGSVILVSSDQMPKYMRSSGLFVRYGAVVYPVDASATANPEVNLALDKCGSLFKTFLETSNFAVILQADPNSISVAPSREVLSYSDRTKAALSALVVKADKEFKQGLKKSPLLNKRFFDRIGYLVKEHVAPPIKTAQNLVKEKADVTIYNLARREKGFQSRVFYTQDEFAVALAEEKIKGRWHYNFTHFTQGIRDTYNIPESEINAFIKKRLYANFPKVKKYLSRVFTKKCYSGSRGYNSTQNVNIPGDTGLRLEAENRFHRVQKKVEKFGGKLTRFEWRYGKAHPVAIENTCNCLLENKLGSCKPKSRKDKLRAFIAPSRTAVVKYMSKNPTLCEGLYHFHIKLQKTSDIVAIKDYFEKIGVEVHDASNEVKKKPAKVKSQEFCIASGDQFLSRTKICDLPKVSASNITQMKDRYFCYGKVINEEVVSTIDYLSIQKYIATYGGNVVLAMNAADARFLRANGFKSIHRKVGEDLVTLANTDRGLLALALANDEFNPMGVFIPTFTVHTSVIKNEAVSILRSIGIEIQDEKITDQKEKDLITALNQIRLDDFSSKSLWNDFCQCVTQAKKIIEERVSVINEIKALEDYTELQRVLDHYRINRMSPNLFMAILMTSIETLKLQNKLKRAGIAQVKQGN